MARLKLLTLVGTRPELIRLSETIKKADKYFNHIFVHTGQNSDTNLSDVFYGDLDLRRPDYYLGVANDNLGQTIGNIIAKSYMLLQDVNPDAFLILGDTNSVLSALSAKRLKIPVFHMEAGNRCFDENLPEEINRRIVDHITDVHLPYTEHARRNLIAEGIRNEYIFVIGSPMREVVKANKTKIEASSILEQLSVEKGKYIVLSAHREENIDNPVTFNKLMNAINALAENYGFPIIYSIHPRSAKYIAERKFKFYGLIREMSPFKFTDYSRLMQDSFCVVSDSGTLSEEAAIHGFPAVSLRTSTERPEALDRGVIILGNNDTYNVLNSVEMAVEMGEQNERSEIVSDYESFNVSSKVIRLIQGYTSVINRDVWRIIT